MLSLQKSILPILPVKVSNYRDFRKASAELGDDLGKEIDGGADRRGYANTFLVFGTKILSLFNGGSQLIVYAMEKWMKDKGLSKCE